MRTVTEKLFVLIEALRDYGPHVKLNSTVAEQDLAEWISMRTNLHPNGVTMALLELKDALLYFTHRGTPVKIPGLGWFSPGINRHGKLRINVRIDNSLRKSINQPGEFTGRIDNRANIGLDNAAFKVMWDAAHPDDPLEI